MGWWTAGEFGGIAGLLDNVREDEDNDFVWGDSVADVLDDAVKKIVIEFQDEWGRKPHPEELRLGMEFALGGLDYE